MFILELNKAPVADIYFPAWKPILAQRKPSYNVSYEGIYGFKFLFCC